MINNVYQCQYCDRNVLMSNKEKHLKECKGKTYLSNYIDKNDDQKENIEISQELSSNKNKDNLPPSYNNHEDTKFAMKIQYEEYNQRIDNQNNDSELARNLQILEFNRHPNRQQKDKNISNKNSNYDIHENYYYNNMSEDTNFCWTLLQNDADELSKKFHN